MFSRCFRRPAVRTYVRLTTKQLSSYVTKPTTNEARIIETLKHTYREDNMTPVENVLKYAGSLLMFPFGLYQMSANHVGIIFRFGKYDGFVHGGLGWIHPFGVDMTDVYCGDNTVNFDKISITDSNKNPIVVSAFVTYQIIDPVKNILNVQKQDVVKNLLESKFREYLCKYSYNDLTSQNEAINDAVILQINQNELVKTYGIEVTKTGILQINYAPEIAEMMLVKQKAKATLEARKEVIDVTMGLIHDISTKLEGSITAEDRSKLVTCLTVSMIGQSSPTPVINMH